MTGLAAARGLEGVLRLSGLRAGLALVYHAVEERAGDPARELVAPHAATTFEAQLRYLLGRYRIVPARDLLEASAARRRGERFPVAIVFDDDLASHVGVALPILRRTDVHATFFLCGASLERPHAFWWERLQLAWERGDELPVAGESIHEVARRIEAMTPAESEAVAEQLGPGPVDAGLRAAGVRALAADGHDVGFHTLRHDRLPGLDDEALDRAMTAGRSELEAAACSRLVTIAYPHGSADGRVAAAARKAGFRCGFTGDYAAVTPDGDPLLLPRIEPTRRPVGRFALQLARALLAAHR